MILGVVGGQFQSETRTRLESDWRWLTDNQKGVMKRTWLQLICCTHSSNITGGTERFSAQEIFEKNLKVSHFYSGFSPDKNNNQIEHSQRVLLEFSESDFKKSLQESRNSDKML